jgi:pimeloyl-ACP methyl ester carboxylesterase
MNEERIFFKNSRGDTLSGVFAQPEGDAAYGAAILCHGMESNKESEKLILMARELAERGFLALRFDFAYVGESSGKFEDITYTGEVEDLRSAFSLVQDRYSGKTAILGSSMGGTVALLFAAQEPSVAALVTVAAPVHPKRFPRRVLTPAQFQQWREHGFTFYNGQRINLSLLHDLEQIDVPQSAKKLACPVLVIHGEADNVVPVAEAYELHALLNNRSKLCILNGADHRLSDPAIMRRATTEALNWIIDQLSRGSP